MLDTRLEVDAPSHFTKDELDSSLALEMMRADAAYPLIIADRESASADQHVAHTINLDIQRALAQYT